MALQCGLSKTPCIGYYNRPTTDSYLSNYRTLTMDYLVGAIVEKLQHELNTAVTASEQAHDSATHSENIAANRYDTLAVEAAYLAHGQSMRIADLKQSISLYKQFQRPTFNASSTIQAGALVCIEDNQGQQQRFLIGPAAGGLRIDGEQG